MHTYKHLYRIWALKLSCVVLSLSLLTAQCSYKFYRFSSFLPYKVAQKRAQSKQQLQDSKHVSHLLSLDKRFNYSTVYVHTGTFLTSAPLLQASAELTFPCIRFVRLGDDAPTFWRGPPLMIYIRRLSIIS
jgi:hypothetical protein